MKNSDKGNAKFKIYPPKKQIDFYKPPKRLIAPFDEMVNKGGGNMIVLGPPGSGKSVYLLNVLMNDQCMKDIFDGGTYCISPTINDDLSTGAFFKSYFDFIDDEYTEDLLKGISRNIQSVPAEERSLSLVLLDDCLDTFKGHRDYVAKFSSIIRHLKTIAIFSLQRLKGIPAGLRANTTISVIFYIPSSKEYKAVEEYHSFFGGEQNFRKCYDEATKVKYSCLLCDFRNMRMYKHGGNTSKPELIWAKYNDDGSPWTGDTNGELNPGEEK